MLHGALPTIYVSNMNNAVRFYTEVLGFTLEARFGDHWASVDCGDGGKIGLHPASPNAAAPGTHGSISVGIAVSEPIEKVVAALTGRGVEFCGPVQSDPKGGIKLAFFGDPDGNDLYLCEYPQYGP